MKNITFVYGYNFNFNSDEIQLGILSLATILKEQKYNVTIVDFNYLYKENILKKTYMYDKDIEIMYNYLLKLNPNIISFYTMCDSYQIPISLSKKIKEINPNIKIIFGGPQASLTAEESMKQFPWIDVIGIGEGESNIKDIIGTLISEGDFKDMKGIAYRKNNKILCNNETDLIYNLDNLPFLDYSLIDMKNRKRLCLDVGRGCPFGCSYCSTKTFWKRKYRLKSSNRIINEIKYLVTNYNIKDFIFVHDLFTANKFKVIELCNLILKENLKITWTCSARIDTLDEELISKMALSGCRGIYLGIESGSERMQKIINKNLKLSNVYIVIDILKKYKIEITCSFIYGFPEETFEDIEKTLSLIEYLSEKQVKNIQMHPLSILPGTEVFYNTKKKLVLSNTCSDVCNYYGYNNNYIKELIRNNVNIFPQFYELPTEIRKELIYLDVFIIHFYPLMLKYFISTYKILLNNYNNSILQIFKDFKIINMNEFKKNNTKFTRNINTNYNLHKQMEFIERYIYNTDFGYNTELLRELFKFEISIFKFTYESKEKEKVEKYNYNVYKIKKYGLDKTTKSFNPIKIKFVKLDNIDTHINKIYLYVAKNT